MREISGDMKNRILDILNRKPMSLSELSRTLKLRREFVTGYLEAMRHEGVVDMINIGKSKVYRPKGVM